MQQSKKHSGMSIRSKKHDSQKRQNSQIVDYNQDLSYDRVASPRHTRPPIGNPLSQQNVGEPTFEINYNQQSDGQPIINKNASQQTCPPTHKRRATLNTVSDFVKLTDPSKITAKSPNILLESGEQVMSAEQFREEDASELLDDETKRVRRDQHQQNHDISSLEKNQTSSKQTMVQNQLQSLNSINSSQGLDAQTLGQVTRDAPSQIQPDRVVRIVSVQSGQFEISEGDGYFILGAESHGGNTIRGSNEHSRPILVSKQLNHDQSSSEFAFTELQRQQVSLPTSQKTFEERSVTQYPGSACGTGVDKEDSVPADSVTDTYRYVQNPYSQQINPDFNFSLHSGVPSETEQASSMIHSMNPNRSERVYLEPFAKEDSEDKQDQTATEDQYSECQSSKDQTESQKEQIPQKESDDDLDSSMRAKQVLEESKAAETSKKSEEVTASDYTPAYEDEFEDGEEMKESAEEDEEMKKSAEEGEEMKESADESDHEEIDQSAQQEDLFDGVGQPSQVADCIPGYESDEHLGVFDEHRATESAKVVPLTASDQNLDQFDLSKSANNFYGNVEMSEDKKQNKRIKSIQMEHEFNHKNDLLQFQDHLEDESSHLETEGVQPPHGSVIIINEDKPTVEDKINESPEGDDPEIAHSLSQDDQHDHSHDHLQHFESKSQQSAGRHATDVEKIRKNFGTEMESGVEQYESDDANEDRNQFSSLQQTSITNELTFLPHKVSYPHMSEVENDSAMIDSLAYDTVNKHNQAISLSYEYGVETEDQLMLHQNPDMVQNPAISVHDESEKAVEEVSPNKELDGFSPIRLSQPLVQNDVRGDVRSVSQGSNRTQDSILVQDESKQVPNISAQQSTIVDAPLSKEINILDESDFVQWNSPSLNAKSDKKQRKQKKKQGSDQCVKKKSPKQRRYSQSPRQQSHTKSKRKSCSKSPATGEKKSCVRNGRYFNGNKRNSFAERNQFPIRQSNFNPKTVQQMLVTMDTFQESERMMMRMKSRIQKFNLHIVPFAQQYYHAMQLREPLPLVPVYNYEVEPVDESFIDQNSTLLDPTASFVNQQSIQTPSKMKICKILNKKHVQKLPDLLKNVDRTRAESPWTMDGINNIQVKTAKFPESRGHNIEKISTAAPITTSYNQATNRKIFESLKGPINRRNEQRQAPGTAIAVQRETHSGLLAHRNGSDSEVRINEECDQEKNQIFDLVGSTQIPTQYAHSEFRFRAKKPNKKIIQANRQIGKLFPVGNEDKTKPVAINQSLNLNTLGETDNQTDLNQITKSNRSWFHPNENLSLLIQANNAGIPISDSISFNRFACDEGMRVSKNKTASMSGQKRRQSKAQTMEQIYAENMNVNKARRTIGNQVAVKIRAGQLQQHIKSMQNKKPASIESNYKRQSIDPLSQHSKEAKSIDNSKVYNAARLNSHARGQRPTVKLLCRTTGNNSQRTLTQQNGREIKTSQQQAAPGEILTRSIQNSGRLFKHRFSTRDQMNGSVMKKFLKWLDQGSQQSQAQQPISVPESRIGRRKINDRVQIVSARANAADQSNSPNQKSTEALTDFGQNEIFMESFDICKENNKLKGCADTMKISDAIAAKMLQDPTFGETVEERKMRIRSLMKQRQQNDLIQQQHMSIRQDYDNTLLQSLENIAAPRSVAIGHRAAQRQIALKTVSSGESVPQQLQKITELSQQQKWLFRQSQQTAKLQQLELFQRVQMQSKLTNPSSIYAVPQGRKRIDFLRDNYVKGQKLDAAAPKSKNRYQDRRKSQSPRQQVHNQQPKSVRQTYYLDNSQQRKLSKSRQSSRQSIPVSSLPQDVNALNHILSHPTTQTQATDHLDQASCQTHLQSDKVELDAVEMLHQEEQQHPEEEDEDFYINRQITLNMDYKPDESVDDVAGSEHGQIQVGEDQVDIDQNSLHILTQAAAQNDVNESDDTGSDGEHKIDHLQEREILEDEDQTLDVPVVVAEDEIIASQNLQETQQDPILGEQSISEDEAGEVAQKNQQIMQQQRNNISNFQFPTDALEDPLEMVQQQKLNNSSFQLAIETQADPVQIVQHQKNDTASFHLPSDTLEDPVETVQQQKANTSSFHLPSDTLEDPAETIQQQKGNTSSFHLPNDTLDTPVETAQQQQDNNSSFYLQASTLDNPEDHESHSDKRKEADFNDIDNDKDDDDDEDEGDDEDVEAEDSKKYEQLFEEEKLQVMPLVHPPIQESGEHTVNEELDTDNMEVREHEVDDADDEDYEDDYYADDKFVYEDEAEDPSSEDPEQKFLKSQALSNKKLLQSSDKMQYNDEDDEDEYSQDDDEEDDHRESALLEDHLEHAHEDQPQPSKSSREHAEAPDPSESYAHEEEVDSADDYDHEDFDNGQEDIEGDDAYDDDEFEDGQNDNDDEYSAT